MKDNKINDLKEVKKVCKISPFRCFCTTLGELPTTYFETMSYYETLMWLIDYLKNTILPKLNENLEATKELQDKFKELVDWINNYFNDLDLEPIVREVLDKMAEDGTLARIINEELFGTINNNITQINLKLEEIENTLRNYTADFTEINNEIEKIKTKNTEQDNSINDLKTKNTEQDNSINDLKAKVNNNTINITKNANDITKLNTFASDMDYTFGTDIKPNNTNYINHIVRSWAIILPVRSAGTKQDYTANHSYSDFFSDINGYNQYSNFNKNNVGSAGMILNGFIYELDSSDNKTGNPQSILDKTFRDAYSNISDIYFEYTDNNIVEHVIDDGKERTSEKKYWLVVVAVNDNYLFHKRNN